MIGKTGDMIHPPRVAAMIPPLDIFWVDSYGNVRWFEHAGDFDAAKARLKALGIAIPGRYVVFSERTGHRTVFNVDKRGQLSDVTGIKPLSG